MSSVWVLVLCTFVLLLQSASLLATTYWVSKQGSDSNPCFASSTEPNLQSQSRATIKAGSACLATGDTLMVKTGSYSEQLVNVLPNGATLRSADSDPAKWFALKPQNNVVANETDVIRHTQNRNNITYRYIRIDLSAITSGSFPHACVGTGNAAVSLTIEDFECIGPTSGMMSWSGSGLSVGTASTWTIRRGTIKNLISTATGPERPGAHGLYFQASNSLVENVWIENVDGRCVNWRGSVAVSNNTFRHNVCKNTTGGPGGDFGSGGTNNRIYNNVMWNSGPMEVRDIAQVVVQNTFYGNAYGRCIRLEGSGHTLQNNIFLNCGGTAIVDSSSSSKVSHNIITGNARDIFSDYTNGDFSLRTGSPAINAGTSATQISRDFLGVSRPQGCCYDAGAFEYGAQSPTPAVPPAPGELRATAQ